MISTESKGSREIHEEMQSEISQYRLAYEIGNKQTERSQKGDNVDRPKLITFSNITLIFIPILLTIIPMMILIK